MTDEDLIGLHGKESTGLRWAHVRELNNTAARLVGAGRTTEAAAKFEEAYRLTLVDDLDPAGYDVRARILGNLSSVAEARGDMAEALRFADETIEACANAERAVGDRYGTVAVRTSATIHRAQTFQLLGRFDEALADLDTALALNADAEGDAEDRLLEITVHNTRTVLLIGLERLEEAETAARHTLALANAHNPRLAAHPYSNLGLIAQAHNDHDTAMSYLRLAEQIHTAAGDTVQAALAVANQGRIAARRGDGDAAERLLAAAEQAFLDGEQPLRAAEIRFSRADAAFRNGDNADLARSLLPQAIEVLRGAGHAVILAEALGLQGDMLAVDTGLEAAENAYLECRALYESMGARYHLARIDMRRAITIAGAAEAATDPEVQQHLLQVALYLSLPSALATDAIRHTYTPGQAREQWAATVAIPAMAHALHLAMALRDGALISELLEHMSATVSLHAPTQAARSLPVDAFDIPMPAPSADHLSFAASAFITGTSADFPTPQFALPPRLRVNPNRPSALEPWIAETEQRYGFAIRSDQVVDSW